LTVSFFLQFLDVIPIMSNAKITKIITRGSLVSDKKIFMGISHRVLC
jgi:hypothetical protein